MKIAIGSDKSGYVLKEFLLASFMNTEIEFVDLGTTDISAPSPYFEVASRIAPLVKNGTYEKAILICGTGMGMSIVANKHKGIYAAAVESVYGAKMCRAINNANILCMGGWVIGPEMGLAMAKAFLNTEFLQDLEDWRKSFLTNAERRVKEIEDKIYGK
ncbi:MAG: RpiB/LacA/LacB family sugar-phosphate isomerase [Clostridia bacterium]|nr:RpiB/LacA/LacB family sugar-phosphate isomerase [Clostridia bacterium]